MILCVLLTLLAAVGLLLNALLDQEIGRMIRADIDFANVAVNSSVRENSPDTRGTGPSPWWEWIPGMSRRPAATAIP